MSSARTTFSSNAFVLSACLHAAVVGAFLVAAYFFQNDAVKATKEFILVMGDGNNYEAKEAPALGTPGGVKIDFPSPPVPASQPVHPPPREPESLAPAPEPVIPPPMEAVTPPLASPSLAAKTPDFAKQVKRTEDRTKNKIVAKFVADQKKKAEADAKAAELERKKLTYEEFMKEHNQKTAQIANVANSPLKTPRIDTEGILKGVAGGSTANKAGGAKGTALSSDEDDRLGNYFKYLKQRLQEAHEKPMGVSDLLRATAEFYVAADGTISQVRISRSSGNSEFDQSVLAAFRSVDRIRRRPDNQGSTVMAEFRMKEDD